VQSKHPAAWAAEIEYRRIEDVLNGQDAVRSNARLYVPQTAEHRQHPELYDEMIGRGSFTNYVGGVVDSYEGTVFRKDPSIQVPARYNPRLENINNAGDGANVFSKKIFREVLTKSRVGILVDALPAEKHNYSSPNSLLPYLSIYTANNIFNWRPGEVDGEPVPDQIILREYQSIPQEFGSTIRERRRVLALDEKGRYRVRLYDHAPNGDFYLSEEHYPTTGSGDGQQYLTKIPFVFVTPIDLSPNVYHSPILGLVDANLAHYQLECEYKNSLHYSAHPTLVISGWPEGAPAVFRIGGNNAFMLPEGCTASILEFHGSGLEPLEHAMAAEVDKIAEMGMRLAQNTATGPETAEAARIRQYSKTSVISSIARTVSDGIQAALEIACKWALIDGEISVELNQDYLDVMMAPQMLAEIVRTTREGLMTRRDAIYNMQRGELLEPGRTLEQIEHALDTEKPTLIGGQVNPIQQIMGAARAPEGGRGRNRGRGRNGQAPPADDDTAQSPPRAAR
jgi:hypothetical protein